MKFNKYVVALKLSKEGVGREKVIEGIFNRRMFDNSREVSKYKELLDSNEIGVVSSNESPYPKLLKQIYDYPLVLFTKGDISLLQKRMITVVGTRDMSSYGKWCVGYILRVLQNEDIVVVSGLANGVDAQVHNDCLKYGISTIAVVAGGIDRGYPKRNQTIYDKICSRGLILSEFPPGRKIIKGMFPMRNRILAGISSATVVIESDIRGGSLITLNLALEYGRDIFCAPCDIGRYSLQGCNMMIGQGAIPLYSPNQLLKFCENKAII